jgi:putative ABC transport system permease protein
VGVVADTKQFGLDKENAPQLYLPYQQWPRGYMKLVIRVAADLAQVVPALKGQVWGLDRKIPITSAATMAEVVSESMAQRRFNSVLLGSFSVVALVLAAVGTYSVISYTVNKRMHEIGVRMALGADRHEILGMILGQGLRLALLGLALGLAGALALTRVMTSMLFGVKATDPITFVAVSILLAAMAMLAASMPARRAVRVDPIKALRCE